MPEFEAVVRVRLNARTIDTAVGQLKRLVGRRGYLRTISVDPVYNRVDSKGIHPSEFTPEEKTTIVGDNDNVVFSTAEVELEVPPQLNFQSVGTPAQES